MRTSEHLSALATGARLNIYLVERVLGAGGFGITYRAREDITERIVAVKEYLPSSLAVRGRDGASVRPVSESLRTDYEWGLARFREEAKLLIGLKHPNIVPVLSYFEANGTGYLVMEFQAGRSLGEMLAKGATLDEREMRGVLLPLLDGVEAVHKHGFLHRDIKPDNIFVREDGSPVLLDFGAARQALGQHSKSLTAVLTEGYAPYEQYHRDGNQGPWTDIYALGAVMFRCLLGNKPAEAPKRVDARFRDAVDPLAEDFARLGTVAAPETRRAIEAALGLREGDRPQSIAALRALLRPLREASAGPSVSAPRASARPAPATPIALEPASREPVSATPARAPRRGRVIAYAVAGAVLFAGAAFGAFMIAGGDDPDAAQIAAAREAEEAKRRAEAQRKADEEKARLEAERRRQEERAKTEAEAKRKAEEDAARRRAEEEARRKAEDEKERAERTRREAEQRKKAEEDAQRRSEEQRKAEEERGKADQQKKAEAERADAEAKRKTEAEAKRKAERIAAASARARERLGGAAAALQAKRLLEAKRLAAEAGAALRELALIEPGQPELAALRRQHEALDADVKREIAARVGELVRAARDAIKANRAADAKQRLDEAAMLDPGSADVAAARRELSALRRDDAPGAPGARYPRAQLTQMVYQRIMAAPAHSVTMYKGAEHTRALYACVDWNASTPQNVVVHGYGYGYKWNSTIRARDTALQYCRPHQAKGCECTLVDETSGPALTLPGGFSAKYAN